MKKDTEWPIPEDKRNYDIITIITFDLFIRLSVLYTPTQKFQIVFET